MEFSLVVNNEYRFVYSLYDINKTQHTIIVEHNIKVIFTPPNILETKIFNIGPLLKGILLIVKETLNCVEKC